MLLQPDDWVALRLTFELAAISTGLLLLIGLPLAWTLSRMQGFGRVLGETLVATPLVLPPSVLGFYLLLAFSPLHPPGSWLQEGLGISLAFTFTGLVIGSMIYSLPFVVQPLQNAFEQFGRQLPEAAQTLGYRRSEVFFRLVIPGCRSGIFTAACLGFAHTVGEFGVVLMIGGNIPGETRVASIALYDHVEALNFAGAHRLAMTLLGLSLVMLFFTYLLRRRGNGPVLG